ncbi:MAG: HlyC/CorC family transporter [Polyangiaceae bacterium]|nr:HlyC/CorC family transporter [Polyangiaceae bacterium]
MVPWLGLVLLVAINALYVAAEFAAVGVQRSDVAALARRGSPLATKLLAVIEDGFRLDRYIAACQIGITLSSLVAGAYGQVMFAVDLGPWLGRTLGVGHATAESAAFVVVLLVLTTAQVVFGELVPKSLALKFSVRSALVTFLPTRWSASALRGFIWLLDGSRNWLLRPFGITPGGHQHVQSPEEIEVLLSEARREGALSADAHRRLERGLYLSSRTVRQLMTSRSEVYGLDVSMPPAEMLERVLESPFGRLLVYRGSLDDVLGVVSIKEVVAVFVAQGALPRLDQVLRPIRDPSRRAHGVTRAVPGL